MVEMLLDDRRAGAETTRRRRAYPAAPGRRSRSGGPAGPAHRARSGYRTGPAHAAQPAGAARAARLRVPRRGGSADLFAAASGRWHLALGVLGAVALCAVCGLSAFFLAADELRGGGTGASVPDPRAVGPSTADPAPLTVSEVFPGPAVVVTGEAATYPVLASTLTADCGSAVTGRVAGLLARAGCTQVVRATLRSPDGGYILTAGVVNFADTAGANRAYQQIKVFVDAGQGSFRGMPAGPGTEAVAKPTARIGWHVRGQFLVYGVVARVDGRPVPDTHPQVRRILSDLVRGYLRESMLSQRVAATT